MRVLRNNQQTTPRHLSGITARAYGASETKTTTHRATTGQYRNRIRTQQGSNIDNYKSDERFTSMQQLAHQADFNHKVAAWNEIGRFERKMVAKKPPFFSSKNKDEIKAALQNVPSSQKLKPYGVSRMQLKGKLTIPLKPQPEIAK